MQVTLFEEHHHVLAHWVAAGYRQRTLICFDAHLDVQHISEARIKRLRQADSPGEIRQLAKSHHLLPDDGNCYGIEDFLYAARKLEVIRALVWVAPPHVDFTDPSAAVAELAQSDGITPETLQSARRITIGDEVAIVGQILDLPVTICRHTSLPALDVLEDTLVDIDIDYFVHLPGDSVWIHPRNLLSQIASLGLRNHELTVSRSVDSGFTPLWLRFLADFLAALAENRTSEVEHHERLLQTIAAHERGEIDAAQSLVDDSLSLRPECAATHLIAAELDTGSKSLEHLQIAAVCDDKYRVDPLRMACEYPARHRAFTREDVSSLADLASDSQPSATPALTQIAIGLLWCHLNDLPRATECYNLAKSEGVASRELALELGRRLHRDGDATRAKQLLQAACGDDKTTTTATFWLGVIALEEKRYDEAADLARQATMRAPAWKAPQVLAAEIDRRRTPS